MGLRSAGNERTDDYAGEWSAGWGSHSNTSKGVAQLRKARQNSKKPSGDDWATKPIYGVPVAWHPDKLVEVKNLLDKYNQWRSQINIDSIRSVYWQQTGSGNITFGPEIQDFLKHITCSEWTFYDNNGYEKQAGYTLHAKANHDVRSAKDNEILSARYRRFDKEQETLREPELSSPGYVYFVTLEKDPNHYVIGEDRKLPKPQVEPNALYFSKYRMILKLDSQGNVQLVPHKASFQRKRALESGMLKPGIL